MQRLHSQEFNQMETQASLEDREILERHIYPFSYDTSFQLRKALDDQDQTVDEAIEMQTMPVVKDHDEEDCETDYGFYGEGEEDEEMEDSESEVDQDGHNDELILSTMIHSIANDGQGSNRKTKTIFSVDAPLASAQEDSGPGVNGDGLEPHHHQQHSYPSIKMVSSSASRATKEIEVLYRKQEEPRPRFEEADVDTELDEDGTLQEEKCSRIRAASGCIEILPELEEEFRRCSSIGMERSRKFSLIMLRSTEEIGKKFEKPLEISNLTRASYGFKVWCNSSAYSHLDINPSLGLLLPGRQLTVEIKTRGPLEHEMKCGMDKKDRIEVRIFKAYTDDPVRLQASYEVNEKLLEQRPDLISTQVVDKLILWDAADISGRLELFKSITDEEEQADLKEELHNILLGEFPSQTMTMIPLSSPPTAKESLLRQIREQVRITDFNIKESLKAMVEIRNIQQSIFLMLFLCCAGSLLLSKAFPKDSGHQVPVEHPAEAASYWASFLNIIGFN